MKTVELLRQLQGVDSALDADREHLRRVEAELADRAELAAAAREQSTRAAALHALEADQRDLELEIDTLRTQLETIDKKLYGGRVGDARELTNLTRDAQQVRAQIGTREDRLLGLFEASEQAASELARADAELRDVRDRRRVREAELSGERDRLLGAVSAGEARQEALRASADATSLRTYDTLRRTRGGLAVADLRQRTCQGCRVGLPLGLEQRVRQGDALVLCQSCGRILAASG